MDFALTDKLRMYGHMNQINTKQTAMRSGALLGRAGDWNRRITIPEIETPSVNFIYDITPTLINETTFGVHHWDEPGSPLNQAQWAKIQRSTYGLQGLGQWYPAANAYDVIPFMSFSDVANAAAFSTDARFPIDGATTVFTIADNITKVVGKHTFKRDSTSIVLGCGRATPGRHMQAISHLATT